MMSQERSQTVNKCVGVGVGLSFIFSHVPVVVVLRYSFTVFPTHVPTHTPQIHALNTRAVVFMAEAKLKLPETTTTHTCASKFSFIHSFIFFFFVPFFFFFLPSVRSAYARRRILTG